MFYACQAAPPWRLLSTWLTSRLSGQTMTSGWSTRWRKRASPIMMSSSSSWGMSMTMVSRVRLVSIPPEVHQDKILKWIHQVVSVPFHLAHPKLLLPGFADYHTEENVEKYVYYKEYAFLWLKTPFCRHKDIILPEDSIINSSASAKEFITFFSKRVFDICLSNSTPWTIEKWHIKASLRQVLKLISWSKVQTYLNTNFAGNIKCGSVMSKLRSLGAKSMGQT